MTNEEKLREIFPKTIFIYRKEDDKTVAIQCSDEWLNAEYQEPTTKNDLGVDCISRKQAIEEADKLCLETGYDNEKVEEMLRELPSVTPQEPCDKCEVGNPCLYCKHEFEPQESEG